MNGKMNANELYRWGYQHESSAIRFLTNVIQVNQKNPVRKMKSLFALVANGADVRIGSEIDTVRINGRQFVMSDGLK